MAKISFWMRIKNFFTGKKQPTLSDVQVKDGIWYAKQSDGNYLLGIDESVYQLMGKITFADFPTQLKDIQVDDDLLDIEGDKSVETLKSPIAGTVIEQNADIGKNIDTLNEPNPQVNWIVKVKPLS
ncbi:glycine cleavage system protein H [Lentilactobacillus hilgardii]|jgi:glycine cleavage system H protein|uniref:Glycine cleavage H-protein n=2 Tax=Lentilactobacillus hilgardii TaxID=1588 RepID=C0XGM6_LENH9|nr:glycine cleavage system protein H [Lentilactobacillus hilgardii]EEI19737.1 glycine cleavage H-protein [Lentilactobacillus buchneri ATCC 11577]MCI1923177.1 glycine cleavage system protein H [Lentilactobacillus buchneri]RRG12492.1 MAG: glycine cleavage system protein H [Lactobacillus sp.]EEI25438.1 glycine cleavage H-protein [Lentilactobacillus hilgardii DSM 20176 = ATCC 8290]EEI71020.1 glycine cleavage H-protein [Lentilactobacillus hilgardii ATCC 27305]